MIKLQIKSSCIQIPEALENRVRENLFSLIIESSNKEEPDYSIYNNDGIISILKKSDIIFSSININEAIYNLEWNIVDDLISKNGHFLQIHSAALTYDDNAYLFIGNPGTGKTSTSILLSKNGFNVLSDEVGLLDLDNLELNTFPRNYIIKQHLFSDIDIRQNQLKLMIDSDDDGKEPAYFLPINYFNKNNNLSSKKLKKIFFLQNSVEHNLQLDKIGNHESFNQIMPQIFNIEKFNQKKIIDLIKTIPCYKLKLSKPLLFDEILTQKLINEITK